VLPNESKTGKRDNCMMETKSATTPFNFMFIAITDNLVQKLLVIMNNSKMCYCFKVFVKCKNEQGRNQ
jgi:hypothetical protein